MSVQESKRLTTILRLLEKINRPVWKTSVQKAIYLLQEGLGEFLDYDFRLRFYGPYSQKLANDLAVLKELGLISEDCDSALVNYRIAITQKGKDFLNELSALARRGFECSVNDDKLEKLLSLVKEREGFSEKEVELLGNVFYFARLTDDRSKIKKQVNMLKPHFPEEEIERAIEKLEKTGMLQELQ